MSVDKQILERQGNVGCHNTLPCHVGIQILVVKASYHTTRNRQLHHLEVLQQHLFNSKTDTLAVAIDLGDMLKDASKNVCVREQWYLLISSTNPSNYSVMWTDP